MTLKRLVFDFLVSPFVGTSITLLDGKNLVMEGCVRGVVVYPTTRNKCHNNA